MNQLEYLDDIAREAWAGNFARTGPLSTGERLYVALASGRMRELCPSDSIAYAVDRVGRESMQHMLQVWRGDSQPTAAVQDGSLQRLRRHLQLKLDRVVEHISTLEMQRKFQDEGAVDRAKVELAVAITEVAELRAALAYLHDFENEEREFGPAAN